MAVINPADLPPGDTRPIYSKTILPGGPWNRYRPAGWVNGHRVDGAFLIRQDNGTLLEQTGPVWVVVDPKDPTAIALLTPAQFAAQFVLDVG